MVTETSREIARRVDESRTLAGVTVLQLADDTGIPRTTLRRKLLGQYDFTIPELQSVATVLAVPFSGWVKDLPGAA